MHKIAFERVRGTTKTYRTTEPCWVFIPKGFKFEVSVPRFLWWLIDPHDPEWLAASLIHDANLELLDMAAWESAWLFRQHLDHFLTRRRWLIWPAYFGVLIWTTATRSLRRVFSCLKGQD